MAGLSILNPNPKKIPGPQLLHDLVQCDGSQDAVAIEYTSEEGETSTLSYEELHMQADALARRITTSLNKSATQSKRLIVPILIPQCSELYISQLAILKAGGAFCPIVLDTPEERLRFIVADVEASLLLTTSTLQAKLPDLEGLDIIAVDDGNDSQSSTQTARPVSPHDPAYIMYTSGSTGQPKGVCLSHSAATQALLAHDRHIPSFSRFLQFASPTFDVSVFEIFFPLFRGRTLVCCDRRRLLNDLPAAINEMAVDACELTPSVAGSLLRRRESVPSLKVLLTIGEMLKPSVVEEFGGDSNQPAILHGMYGPTEATIHCTLQTNFSKETPCGIIGVPLDTVSAFVIRAQDSDSAETSNLEILPLGEEGELAVGGYQLADGYLNRDEQTKAAFVRHLEHGMLYRTGDLARMRQDGVLECRGRISTGQVKLRGQRIELGEIEHAASKADGCRDVVAEVVAGVLVVFCVQDAQGLTRDSILKTCRKWLPAFMVPGDVVILDSLPYLASGKCDRKALRSRYEATQQSEDTGNNNDNGISRKITEVISSVLQVETKPDSILPGLGLDSLSSIRIASALHKAGLPQLDASSILTARTPRDIASQLERDGRLVTSGPGRVSDDSYRQKLDDTLTTVLLPASLSELETSFLCTPVQVAMLTETQKDPQAYCNSIEFLLPKSTNLESVETALRKLANQHPLLRSGFTPVTDLQAGYATMVWKTLSQDQVKHSSQFSYDFQIDSDEKLLRPCNFQLAVTGNGTRVLLHIHHALYDQWSIDLFRLDLARLLRGDASSHPASFKVVADYCSMHAEEAPSSEAVEFWQDHLREVAPTSMPLLRGDEVESALQRTSWQHLSMRSSTVKARAKELGYSGPALFQSVMAYFLSTYAGTPDIVLGSVFSGRNLPIQYIDSAFGPCLATLPFRVDFGTTRTFKDLLQLATDQNRALQQHILTPPTTVREAAGISPGTALFDSLFVWQESTHSTALADDLVRIVDSEDRLEFNLVLEFEPSPSNIKVRATYEQRLMSEDFIQVLLHQIDTLTARLLDSPDCLIQDLATRLSPELLSIQNPDPSEYAASYDLTTAIEARAEHEPSVPAVTFAKSMEAQSQDMISISYKQLDQRANQISHALIESGVKPQDIVCICMEKCIDLYVSMLAVFKAGAGYLPLAPETPVDRIKSVLAQANIKHCICDSESATVFEETTTASILDIAHLDLDTQPSGKPKVEQHGSRVAYAVFTSGSTGEPKGVPITMDNLKSNLAVLHELYQVQPGDRLLQSCSQAFDVSVFEIFFAFYSGMTLCSATKDVMFRDFEESIRSFRATHLSLTPTVAALVKPENVPDVRFLVTAGEGITERVHRTWAGHGLHQGYGPSETTNICSVKMNIAPNEVLGNIGPAFKNTSAFVLAAEGDFQILPAGAYGEFAFGGEQVFHGYIGRDELNAEKIINHPQFGRVYRSGDMGRILPDGTLLISGRVDDQVKIRGNRVELGEINAVVSDHSGVSDCTTIVAGERSADQALATFWVSSAEQSSPDSEICALASDRGLFSQLFDRLEGSLPTYMIPSILVPMNRLPMTAQGKLDKRLLRSILQNLDTNSKEKFSRSHEGLGEDPPTSETEKTMAAILSELLDVDVSSISRNSSFFALGLNSLNAIQFAKLAGRKLNASLGVTAILRHSSIARLGRYISTSDAKGDEARKPKVTTVFQNDFVEDVKMSFAKQGQTIVAVLPCTALQEAMLSASSTQYGAYCNTTKLHFDGDYQKLRDCWEEMIKRHAILRTAFVETPSATHPHAQVVLEDPETMWDAHSSQSKANGAPNGHANGHVNGNANGYSNGATNGSSNGNTDGPAEQHPDLPSVTHQSPVRVDILGTDIYLQMHHAVYDGVAVANLFEEMRRVYRGEKLPPTVAFEPFLEQVLLQNNQEAIDFWTARVSGFQPHPLPQQEQSSGQREDFLHRMLSVSPADIDAFCERHACTSLSLIQAAWVKTLACVQSISDVCFGNVVSGRSVPVPDVDRLVAPCFNTIPVRLDIEKARTNLGLLRNLHRYNVDTLPFQLTAPRRIQMLSSNPSMRLFDTLLLVQPPQDDLDLFEIEEEGMDMGIPIVLEIIPFDNSFELQMHYMPDRVPASLAPQLVDAFCSALGSCLRYPSSSVSHFLDFDTLAIEASLAPEQAEEPSNEADGIADLEGDWSDEQNAIRSAMAELAGVDPANITKQTSLYQIGLDSLNAVQLASRLRGQGFRVDAADVMQYQTPSELSKMLQSRQSERSQEPEAEFDLAAFDEKHRQGIINAVKVDEASVEAVRPCNSSQCGMLAQFIESKGSFYLNHRFYEIPQQHGISDIKQAWGAVQRKHQVLRMGFHQLEDAAFPYAMLIYKPDVHQDMVFPDVDGLDDDAVEDLVSEQVMQNLHLPAWRVSLLSSTEGQKMCLSLHHALYDADSLQVLLEDFAKALQVHDIGPATNLDSLLGSQLQGLTSQKSENEKFWKKALENARLVKFPNLTPTIVSDTRARSSVRSSTVSSSSIETYCKTDGVTIQALGQGVWAMLLGAYLGEPSVTFGTVFSGFVTDSSQPVAFPAISTVPVYCDTTKSASEVVKDMVSYNAGAQKHRFAALSDIQRYAGSVGQALFDTLFVYQKATDSSSDGFNWREVRGFLGVDYVASMEIETSDRGQLNLRLTYDIRSIPEEHAELLLKQYDMLLQSFVDKDSDFKHSDMSVMSHTPPKEPTIPCSVKLLHQFVERGAREHPDKPALEFISNLDSIEKGRKRWTYRELDERGNQIAHLLQQHGVKPGGVVALCMSKSAEASFAFVGTLKAGCAFLAMDPELPLARRKFIVEDSKSQLLFLDSGKPDAEMQEVVKTVELSESDIVHLPTSALEIPPPDPSMTSYCLYTSGTTGTPKGCELTHENAVQAIMSFQRLFSGHWTESSRWLQFASYWFDVSVLEQFWSWSVGVTLVGAPRDLVLEDLAGFIREANITHIDLTPSLARLLTPKDVPSLVNHVFITGGEALKQEIIDAWGPCKTICNGYGPTEATIGVTMNPFIGTDAKPSNIGPAFDNVGAYVFKPGTDELVMRGAVGELCVSGKLVGKGYLNRPDLTAKAFPYLDKYGERVYRTGDLVRLLADGSVSFIGRADTQAKLRGQRLEIDEIDAVIKTAAEGIFEVASLVSKSGDREMLISFVVDEESMSRDLQVVNSSHGQQLVQAADQACRSRLPGYMVPTHIVPVSRLPLTVNNKVDCKRLVSLFAEMTAQDLQKLKGSQTNDRQLRPTEQKIAKILSKLLSIDADDISPNSNVFSLGLSSVSAINFVTSLKHRGFKAANVARIMNNPILEHLSKAISDGDSETDLERNAVKQAQLSLSAFAQRYRSTAAKVLSIDLKKVEAVAPCTPLQEGLLIESMKTEHKPYFNHFWYDVFRLDLQRLETALHGLWNTIPMLRTSFFRTDDGYAQVVRGSADLPLEICDVQESKAEKFLTERREEWLHGAESDVSRPFEVVIARSKDKAIMAAHVHHASYDGISWELTMGLLTDLYEGKTNVASGPKFLDALPYGPLCHRPDAKSFWQQRLEDGSFMPLPIITEDEAVSDLSLHTSIDDVEALEATRKQLGVSHQALFQTAFAIALHQLSPETQSYGVVLSGRSISLDDADKVIGPLFNTVPFVVSLQSSSSWEQHLRQSQESNAAVLPFQHTPLREIRKYCGRPPGDPMFDVLFVFQRSDASSGQTLFESIDVELPAEYPIAFEVELEDSGHVSVNVAAQRKFVSEGSMQTLLNDFKTALDCIVKDHSKPISDNFKVRRNGPSTSAQDRMKQAPDMNGVSDFTWTDNAKVLQGVIAQVAGCDAADVDEHSTIFNLGLDSIDAVKMASRLKKEGLSIPVSTILQNQTIPRMLDTVQTGQQNEYDATVPSKLNNLEKQLQGLQKALDTDSQSEVERILPAAPGQEGLIADMMRSGFREYYNSDILRLREDVDIEKLKSAWQSVVDAAPILRTSFLQVADPDIDATFAQVVHRPAPLQFDDVSAHSLEDLDAHVDKVRMDVQATSESKSPLRLALATVASDKYLMLSLAHAQYDGHSLALVHQDVAKAYRLGTLDPRPPYDKAIELALSSTSGEALDFWRNNLSGGKASYIQAQEADVSSVTHRAKHTSKSSADRARDACKRAGVSMQALAQATWALLLAHRTQQLEVIFGAVLACRDSEEAEEILFATMNTVPVRSTIHGSGLEMLRYAQEAINEMRPYQRTPLRAIQNACSSSISTRGSASHGSLFDTLFIFQNRGEQDQDTEAPLYESVGGDSNVEYPVAVEIEAVDNDLLIRAACKSSALDKQGTKRLLQDFDRILETLIQAPDDQTIAFNGDQATICGLPGFQVHDERFSDMTGANVPTEQESSDDDDESPLTGSIRSALAKVSKIPEADVLPSSTIESIGIDSISAIKVSAILRKESIKLSVSDLLKAQTPSRMADAIEAKTATPVKDENAAAKAIAASLGNIDVAEICRRAGVDESNLEAIAPATAGQVYMLSMWQRSKGLLFYPTFRYHLQTQREFTDLQSAWMQLVKRNPILRTVFASSDTKKTPVLQLVLKSVAKSFVVDDQDISSSSTTSPLVKMQVKKGTDGFDLSLRIHHALYDAVSLPKLMEQFESILERSTTPGTEVNFKDFLALRLQDDAQTSRKTFWTRYLAKVHPISLAKGTKAATKKVQIFKPAFATLGAQLEQRARKAQVTAQALLFAIYAKVYAIKAVNEEGDVVFGIYLANRSHLSGLDQLTAPTLNLLPLLVQSPKDCDLVRLAKQIDTDLRLIGSMENSAASLQEIYEWTGVKLDSFVNFLKLPSQEDGEYTSSGNLTVIDDEWDRQRITVQDVVEPDDFALPQGLKGFEPSEAYQHALDVEISMVDNDLNIGVFCLERIMNLERAEGMVSRIKKELESFAEQS